MDHDLLSRLVVRCCPELDGQVESFEPIRTGKFNTSYWVHTRRQDYVLRVAPPPGTVLLFYERDMMRQEPEVHALVLARTQVPVARIVGYDFSRTLIDRDFLLMERLPGRPWTEAWHVDSDEVLRQVGACLAQVHRIHGKLYGYLGAHRPMEPQARWVDAFAIMWNKLIDDVVATGHYSDEESSFLRRLLDRYGRLFDRDIPPSLLHMDIWHQNILIDERGRLTGIVDWDRALWGDPEIEFAVLDYCGISEPAFWEGYGQRRDQSREARIRQVFYYLYELQKYIVIRHGRNGDPQRARRYKEEALRIAKRHLAGD